MKQEFYRRELELSLPDSHFILSPRNALILSFGIIALVSVVDLVTPAELDVGLFYSLALISSVWTRSRRILWLAMCLAGIMVFAGALVGREPHANFLWSMIWSNRALAVCELIILAALMDFWIRNERDSGKRSTLIRQLAGTLNQAQAIIRTLDGDILFWSDGAERLYGWSSADALSKTSHQILQTVFPDPLDGINATLIREGQWSGELRHISKDGTPIWVASQWALHATDGQSPVVIEVNNEIGELKRTEAALAQSERRFRRLSEADLVGIIVTDSEYILEANDYFLNMLGYQRDDLEKRALKWRDLTPPEYLEKTNQAARLLSETGRCPAFEKEYRRKDGSRVPVLVGSVALDSQILAFVIDQTSRKRVEAQLAQAQKLESVGQLAGGIAHDFNNLLTIIIGYSEMLLLKNKDNDALSNDLEEVFKAADRAAALTRQLLLFSRHQPSEKENIHLNPLISNVNSMLRRLISEDIEIILDLAEDAGVIQADAIQIEQVIFNLAVNARDAMPDGGKLVIETCRLIADEQFSEAHLGVHPGPYAVLTVSDTGTGMSAEVKEHIFEPFFSTKERGKGTGLGLATVYGIVKQMGGTIWVYSDPGRGSVFKLLFPAIQGAADNHPQHSHSDSIPSGSATILLAEDEPAVRKYIRKILEQQGYLVLEAENGKVALDLAAQYQGKIQLLLTDVVMPERGGDSLTSHFSQTHPEMPVLRMSGYTDRIRQKGDVESAYIQKPFTAPALLGKIRELLPER